MSLKWKEFFYVANLLTLSRILVSPLILVFFDSLLFLFFLGLYAAVSDLLDGYFARRYNQCTRLGAILDPIADRAFVLFVLIAAIVHQLVDWWMILILILRDAYSFLAYMIFLIFFREENKKLKLAARLPGKVVTAIQFLILAMLSLLPFQFWREVGSLYHARYWPFYLLLICSLWAIYDYQRHYWRRTHPSTENPPTNTESSSSSLHNLPA